MSALPESLLGAAANDADTAQETREWLDALAGRHRRRRPASAPTSCSSS